MPVLVNSLIQKTKQPQRNAVIVAILGVVNYKIGIVYRRNLLVALSVTAHL